MEIRLVYQLGFILSCSISAIMNCACPPIEIPSKLPYEKTSDGIVLNNLMARANFMKKGDLRRTIVNVGLLTKKGQLPEPAVKLITQYSAPIKIKIVAIKEFMNFDCTITFRTMDGQLVNKLFILHWSMDEKGKQAIDPFMQQALNSFQAYNSDAYMSLLNSLAKEELNQMDKRIKQNKNPNSMIVIKIVELPLFVPLLVDIEAQRRTCTLCVGTYAAQGNPIKAHFELSAEDLSDLNMITLINPQDPAAGKPDIMSNFLSKPEEPFRFQNS